MKDIRPAAYPGRSTEQLMELVIEGSDFGGPMMREIERRNRVAAGDVNAMTATERSNYSRMGGMGK